MPRRQDARAFVTLSRRVRRDTLGAVLLLLAACGGRTDSSTTSSTAAQAGGTSGIGGPGGGSATQNGNSGGDGGSGGYGAAAGAAGASGGSGGAPTVVPYKTAAECPALPCTKCGDGTLACPVVTCQGNACVADPASCPTLCGPQQV